MPTKPRPGARAPHHPADIEARRALTTDLRNIRRQLGITQVDVAYELGVTQPTVHGIERCCSNDLHVHVVQNYARTLERAVRLRLCGLGEPRLPRYPHLSAADEDARHRADMLQQMVGVRRRLGVTQKDLGARMGITFYSVSDIERGGHRPALSTYQRYARALGGRLVLRIAEAPVVDHVLVSRAVEGRATLADLSDAERFALLRDHGDRFPMAEWMRRLHASHSSVQRWRDLAERVAA